MNQERLMNLLLAPHVSEKSTLLADKHRQFVFEVARDASKPEIKQAVETMFNVKVSAVWVVNVRGKRKQFGGAPGRRPGWKKAYVALAPGYTIDLMGTE